MHPRGIPLRLMLCSGKVRLPGERTWSGWDGPGPQGLAEVPGCRRRRLSNGGPGGWQGDRGTQLCHSSAPCPPEYPVQRRLFGKADVNVINRPWRLTQVLTFSFWCGHPMQLWQGMCPVSRHSKPDSLPGVLGSRVCQPEVSLHPHVSTKAWRQGEKEAHHTIWPPPLPAQD